MRLSFSRTLWKKGVIFFFMASVEQTFVEEVKTNVLATVVQFQYLGSSILLSPAVFYTKGDYLN